MRVALDATYSVDAQPSGIAVYSRHLLDGLPQEHPDDRFIHCYRPKQFWRAPQTHLPNVKKKLLLPLGTRSAADLFHALNQRVDRRQARKVVSTFHDLFVMTGEYSSPEFRRRFTEQARKAADNSDLIITVSNFTARQVTELLHVEEERIRVIPHGVTAPPASGTRPAREPIVFFVGALQYRKNVERLVEAFAVLPGPWRLVLAGAPTGYRAAEILERIERSPCRGRIEVTGYLPRKDLDDLFARASIFAFPSLDEGFGIPVLEAMAAGVPVLTSNSSALKELACGASRLVDPWRADEISDALEQLANNESLRQELINAGLARAAQFTWPDALKKTYTVYQELV